ncbi:sec-independent protein translocase protein TatA [Promicromonospora umidemergens]|uniref:Sec-independent protein translocase protein TatA n=1 Tax=Promicromonospora umidemergens TaxID=629679 RepID=A0ABP8XNG3_9MICO|nr:Sec-independent protein translocase subunit TatA [Promicromonospora umidemergens]MCP2281963.1 sec-independent protein translocase protein TatA [Promicromonospora umidemergens]
MGAMQPWHWIVLLVVVLLLFGSTRLPGLAKSVGQSMKIFKKEIKDLREDDSDGRDSRDSRAADNAPGGSTTSTTGSTTGTARSETDEVPGLINNRDRDIPKA